MGIMILITECTKYPYLNFLDRHNGLCSLKNNEQITDTAAVPTWCPLPSVPLIRESTQKELRLQLRQALKIERRQTYGGLPQRLENLGACNYYSDHN
jgi:hypothetical protein